MSDDKRFTQWLQEYEAERMPDDMNLWNAIESQLKPARRTTVFPRAGLLVAVLMMILMTAGVYAFDQIINNQVGDEGMNAVAEQGKIAELYITNEVGGEYELAVTLDTIYADSNRVYVTVSATGTAPADDPIFLHLNPHVILSNGDELPFLGFGGGGGGGGGGGDESDRVPFGTSLTMNFDANIIETTEIVLPLTIKVDIAYSKVNDAPQTQGMMLLGETEFVAQVPFNHGITLTPNQTVTAGNIEMRLDKVVIAPSLTRLNVCYVEPAKPENDAQSDDKVWTPSISIMVGEEVIFEAPELGLVSTDYNAETGCYGYNVTAALDTYVGDWTVTIDSLSYSLRPSNEDIQAELDARGIVGTVNEDGGITVETPATEADSIAQETAISEMFASWYELIEGGWTFTFTVPEA
jgi:hypothetical protein